MKDFYYTNKPHLIFHFLVFIFLLSILYTSLKEENLMALLCTLLFFIPMAYNFYQKKFCKNSVISFGKNFLIIYGHKYKYSEVKNYRIRCYRDFRQTLIIKIKHKIVPYYICWHAYYFLEAKEQPFSEKQKKEILKELKSHGIVNYKRTILNQKKLIFFS